MDPYWLGVIDGVMGMLVLITVVAVLFAAKQLRKMRDK